MSATEINSEAFRRATVQSERVRIIGLLCVVAALIAVVLVRGIVLAEAELLIEFIIVLGVTGAYEAFMLRAVNKAVQEQRDLADWVWLLNIFLETLLPTVSLFLLTQSSLSGPYRALTAPAVLAYFFFILLSTLRLRPVLCVTTGVLSALGYIVAVVYTYNTYPETGVTRLETYLTYAVFILIGGFIAGGVAHEIRLHVAAALREAELEQQVKQMEHDLEIARSIQQGLLPSRPPDVDGFEIAGWNQPADQTGGDYYDWQELPDGKIAIYLADATGHGIGPALITSACRAYARISFATDTDAKASVERINRMLADDLPPQKFLTFVVALLDPSTATLELLSAGHGPILHYKAASGELVDCKAQGIPLGMMAAIGYGSPEKISLGPGDMLVVTTDGFFEWEDPAGEEFGIDRLKDVVLEAKDRTPEAAIQLLNSSVLAFTQGTTQADDLTAVILKRSVSS